MKLDLQKSLCRKDAKTIVSRDKKHPKIQHILQNEGSQYKVYQFQIDGDVVTDRTVKKCDYLVKAESRTDRKAYFIELKGRDIDQALKQVDSTIEMFQSELKGYKILRRIITSKVPGIQGSKARDLMRKYKELIIRCSKYEENI